MDKQLKWFLVVLIIGIFLGVCFTLIAGTEEVRSFILVGDFTPDKVPNSEQEILDNCKDLDLEKTAYCIRDNIKLFYFHDPTLEAHTDFETLKEKGGDCYNWGIFIVRVGNNLNFDSEMVYVKENGIEKHGFPLISNGQGYYIIDNLNIYGGKY